MRFALRRSLSLALVSLCLTVAARAEESPALYQATAIVTGTDTRQRPMGFSLTLMEVLVKLSGAPKLRDNPAVIALSKQAEGLSDRYVYVDPRAGLLHHDDQGTYDRSHEMTVFYNPTKVEAALAKLNQTVWRGPRPLLTPILLVRNREPEPFLLSAENPRGAELRATLLRLASEHGLGVHFPTEAELAAWGVGLIGSPAPLGAPDAGRLAVTGTLSWNVQALGWIGTWRATGGAGARDWTIKGVSFDQAFAHLVGGAVMIAAGTGAP